MLSNRLNTNIQRLKLSNRKQYSLSSPKPLNLPRSLHPHPFIHHNNTLSSRTPPLRHSTRRPRRQQLFSPPFRTFQPFTHLSTPSFPRLIPFSFYPPGFPLCFFHSSSRCFRCIPKLC